MMGLPDELVDAIDGNSIPESVRLLRAVIEPYKRGAEALRDMANERADETGIVNAVLLAETEAAEGSDGAAVVLANRAGTYALTFGRTEVCQAFIDDALLKMNSFRPEFFIDTKKFPEESIRFLEHKNIQMAFYCALSSGYNELASGIFSENKGVIAVFVQKYRLEEEISRYNLELAGAIAKEIDDTASAGAGAAAGTGSSTSFAPGSTSEHVAGCLGASMGMDRCQSTKT